MQFFGVFQIFITFKSFSAQVLSVQNLILENQVICNDQSTI